MVAVAGLVIAAICAVVSIAAYARPRAPRPGAAGIEWSVRKSRGDLFELVNVSGPDAVDVVIRLEPDQSRIIGGLGQRSCHTIAKGARVTFKARATMQYGMPVLYVTWGPAKRRFGWDTELPRGS